MAATVILQMSLGAKQPREAYLPIQLFEKMNASTSASDRKLTTDNQCLKVSRSSDKLPTQNLSTFWTARKYGTEQPQDHSQQVKSKHIRQVDSENAAKY